MSNCLMIETKDNRRFFVSENDYPSLIEFSKSFDAEIYRVDLETGKILSLDEFAKAFCDGYYKQDDGKYSVLERKISRTRNRADLLKNAEVIQQFISQKLLAGESVGIRDLRSQFADWKLTDSCFSRHLAKAVSDLSKKHRVEKVGAGKYRMES